MRQRKQLGTSMGDIEIKDHGEFLCITQKRAYDHKGGQGRYIVSLTLDEARQVVANLNKRIALADELQRTGLS